MNTLRLIFIISFDFLTGYSHAEVTTTLERYHFQSALMGTKFQIVIYVSDQTTASTAANSAFIKGKEVEKSCSDYDATSELTRLMKPPATQQVTPLLASVLVKSLAVAEETNGAFDPTIGGHSRNWRRAKTRGKLPTKEDIAAAKKITNWKSITISKQGVVTKQIAGMKLDLGGIAKGYAADLMLQTLNKHGITIAFIAAGGDIRLGNPPPGKEGWRVGLKTLASEPHKKIKEHPFLVLKNCAISTSGDLNQYVEIEGKRYSHIVDPRTGLGLTRRVSATVIAKSAARSDALATACCVDPDFSRSLLEERSNDQLLLITLDPKGQIKQQKSPSFPTVKTSPN